MKDLVNKVLPYLSQYLMDFGAVFLNPKQFIAQRSQSNDTDFVRAFVFIAMSVVVLVVSDTPRRSHEQDIWEQVAGTTFVAFVALGLTAASLRTAWRLVGGKATIGRFVATHCYFAGVTIVVMSIFRLLSLGVCKVFDADLYSRLVEPKSRDNPWFSAADSDADNPIMWLVAAIYVAGILFVWSWAVLAWGAYRQINGLSRTRSTLAGALTILFALIVMPTIFMLGVAMTP
jgi:hypothetical protein